MSIYTITPPDDDRLAALIVEAFEAALPSPDRWKLKEVEQRLSRTLIGKPRQRKPSMWAWWLAGALIMGSAAAWWVYESQQRAGEAEALNSVVEQIVPSETFEEHEPKAVEPVAPQNPIDATTKTQEGTGAQQKRPTIYRRETY